METAMMSLRCADRVLLIHQKLMDTPCSRGVEEIEVRPGA